MKDCLRCGTSSKVSAIGEALKNFVCDTCRLDSAFWEFFGSRVPDMEYEMTEPSKHFGMKEVYYDGNEYR